MGISTTMRLIIFTQSLNAMKNLELIAKAHKTDDWIDRDGSLVN